jgi:hypothetical protein
VESQGFSPPAGAQTAACRPGRQVCSTPERYRPSSAAAARFSVSRRTQGANWLLTSDPASSGRLIARPVFRRAALDISIALPEPGASECRTILYSILADLETAGEIENHVIHLSITPEKDQIQCLFRFESGSDGALFERRLRSLLRRYKLSASAMKVH